MFECDATLLSDTSYYIYVTKLRYTVQMMGLSFNEAQEKLLHACMEFVFAVSL